MKKLIFLFFASIVLFGCVQNQESSLLEKNKECFKHWSTIEKDLNDKFTGSELRAMFYSPKVNSCVFEARRYSNGLSCGIVDVFTREIYEEIFVEKISECDNLKESFYK